MERAGAKALPIFTSMVPDRRTKALGLKESMEKYFIKGERCRIDALIVTCGFSLTILSNPGMAAKGWRQVYLNGSMFLYSRQWQPILILSREGFP